MYCQTWYPGGGATTRLHGCRVLGGRDALLVEAQPLLHLFPQLLPERRRAHQLREAVNPARTARIALRTSWFLDIAVVRCVTDAHGHACQAVPSAFKKLAVATRHWQCIGSCNTPAATDGNATAEVRWEASYTERRASQCQVKLSAALSKQLWCTGKTRDAMHKPGLAMEHLLAR